MKTKAIMIGVGLFTSATSMALTLEEVINKTINTHPDILAVTNERLAVLKEVDRAESGYYPSIDINLGKGWEESNNTTTRNNAIINNVDEELGLSRSEASLQVRQMLFDGMATKSEVERQLGRSDSRAHRVMSEAEILALEAVRVYTDVLRRQKLLQLAQDNFIAHETTHEQIKMRGEYGVGRRSDMQQSEGRLALAKTNLLSEESNLRDAEIAYQRVVGEPVGVLLEPDIDKLSLPATVEDAIATAYESHPTLKVAMADIDAALAQQAAANAPFYPRVDLELDATSNHNVDGVRGKNNDLSAMLRMRYNLYNGGGDEARKQETAYLTEQAIEIKNDTRRQIEDSVRLSWNALATINRQITFFQTYVDSSEKTLEAYLQQFSLGQRTLLDLLDSKNEVLVSSQSLVNAQYDRIYNTFRVLNSTGKLLSSTNTSAPEAANPSLVID